MNILLTIEELLNELEQEYTYLKNGGTSYRHETALLCLELVKKVGNITPFFDDFTTKQIVSEIYFNHDPHRKEDIIKMLRVIVKDLQLKGNLDESCKEYIQQKKEMRGKKPLSFKEKNKGYFDLLHLGDVTGLDKYLLTNDVNQVLYGQTLLYWAVHQNNIEFTRCLVEKGADINKKDSICRTPILIACYFGYYNIVKFLLKCGADTSGCLERAKHGWDGNRQQEIIDLLIENEN